MHRLTITVVTPNTLSGPDLYAALAEKLEEVADELRHNPHHRAFGSFGRGGVSLHYRLEDQAEAEANGARLEWQPGMPYISQRSAS